ncbi:somatostatin receptor type 3-like isoform X1 [Carassius carassius]|uniref:somatostatin receptor type 3-like isoform X1 n=2 Tax=Carassius carassius TaxID=217509 RepID=UPI0028688A48|nr:somatostatin receptor type 3-like isoform X1 [Carassius carassius]
MYYDGLHKSYCHFYLSPPFYSFLFYPRDWLISTQSVMPAIVNLLFNTVSTNTTISFSLVLPLVSVLSLLVGVGGHLLMWLVLMRNPRRRSKPSSVLLLNLSFADLCALLTLPCVLLSASSQNWQLGGGVCVLLSFMTSLTAGVDIFSLAALSVLRYRIVAPSTRPPATPAQVAGTVAVIWLVSIAMALPKVTYIQFDSGCTWSVGRGYWLGFLVPAFLVYYVAPLLCIALHCGLIITHLYRCRGTLAADHRNKKATALLIGSTLVFAISWLPYYVLEFVNVLSPSLNSVSSSTSPTSSSSAPLPASSTEVSLLWEVTSLSAILLICLAPCWNPPLYFLLSKPALKQLRGLLSIMHQHWRAATLVQHIQ